MSSAAWVAVIIGGVALLLLLVVLGMGGGASGGGGSLASGQSTQTPTPTPAPAPEPEPAPQPAPAPAPAATPARNTEDDGKQFCEIERFFQRDGQTWVELDFMQLFVGDEAWAEARKRGESAENDYYVANDNTKLRQFPVRSSAPVTFEDGGGSGVTKGNRSVGWVKQNWDDGGIANLWYFTISNGEVVAIENMWVP